MMAAMARSWGGSRTPEAKRKQRARRRCNSVVVDAAERKSRSTPPPLRSLLRPLGQPRELARPRQRRSGRRSRGSSQAAGPGRPTGPRGPRRRRRHRTEARDDDGPSRGGATAHRIDFRLRQRRKKHLSASASNKVIVLGLPWETTDASMASHFSTYGE